MARNFTQTFPEMLYFFEGIPQMPRGVPFMSIDKPSGIYRCPVSSNLFENDWKPITASQHTSPANRPFPEAKVSPKLREISSTYNKSKTVKRQKSQQNTLWSSLLIAGFSIGPIFNRKYIDSASNPPGDKRASRSELSISWDVGIPTHHLWGATCVFPHLGIQTKSQKKLGERLGENVSSWFRESTEDFSKKNGFSSWAETKESRTTSWVEIHDNSRWHWSRYPGRGHEVVSGKGCGVWWIKTKQIEVSWGYILYDKYTP